MQVFLITVAVILGVAFFGAIVAIIWADVDEWQELKEREVEALEQMAGIQDEDEG